MYCLKPLLSDPVVPAVPFCEVGSGDLDGWWVLVAEWRSCRPRQVSTEEEEEEEEKEE